MSPAVSTRLARVLFLLIAAAPVVAVGGPKEEAEAHIAKAMEAHGQNNFSLALHELETAYALDPKPELLYAIGQVYVKLERCPEAITSYEQFLATNPGAQATADTQQAIETCKAMAAPPPPEPLPPEPLPPVVQAAPAPWYKDKLGGILVGSGVIVGVVGLVVYSGARGDLDDAEAAPSLAAYDELVDSAQSKRMMSVVLIGGGVALIAGGVVRYIRQKGRAEESRSVGVVPARGGGLVTWSGAF